MSRALGGVAAHPASGGSRSRAAAPAGSPQQTAASASKTDRLEIEVRPPSPFRLPRYGGQDGTMRIRGGLVSRYFEIGGVPVTVHAWRPARDRVCLRADAHRPAPDRVAIEAAIERMRFAIGVDLDLTDFYRRFRRDRLLGPLIHLRPDLRPGRVTTAWDALAWAIVGQLIEARRASLIARRIVRRWGRPGPDGLSDTPTATAIANRAPAELESCDLSARRAVAMRLAAREVAAGRIDPGTPAADRRLLSIPQIGPWTVQCLGLLGRGDLDSLPAGDLAYIKLVGRLAGLGRRAEVEEVEHFFEPYRPYRGLVGEWLRQSLQIGRI